MACFLHRTLNQTLKTLQLILIGGISFLFLGLFSGCEKIEEDAPWINVERPLMLFNDTTLLDFYEEEVLSWKLKTAYLERWPLQIKYSLVQYLLISLIRLEKRLRFYVLILVGLIWE